MRTDEDLKKLIEVRVKDKGMGLTRAYRDARSALLRGAILYEKEIDEIIDATLNQPSKHDQEKIGNLQKWAIYERQGAMRLDELEEEGRAPTAE